jgi:hypothetical protein
MCTSIGAGLEDQPSGNAYLGAFHEPAVTLMGMTAFPSRSTHADIQVVRQTVHNPPHHKL